jgi:hypothetical protein
VGGSGFSEDIRRRQDGVGTVLLDGKQGPSLRLEVFSNIRSSNTGRRYAD